MAGVPVRVLIADDEDACVARTAAALDSRGDVEVVGVAPDAAEAARLAAAMEPSVALVGVRLPGGGENALRGIAAASPGTQLIAHADSSDYEGVVAMLRSGANGYAARGGPAEKLAAALVAAARGDTIFDGAVRENGERAQKERRIRAAMEPGRLQIVFQPIVDLDSRAVVGHEALSRFPDEPRRSPDKWFAEAHEVGLGVELELCAVRAACEHSSRLPEGTFMAVNVSPVVAERPELLAALAGAHVDHLVLEVTEHAPIEDYPRFRIAIDRMRRLGAKLAVDDAGAGFASLRHVLELDAELIKLDGSLTQSLDADSRRRWLATTLVEFGRESGASVLAEQIESETQLCELRRLGVHYGQGFHLGRPEPLPRRRSAGRTTIPRRDEAHRSAPR